MLVLPIAAPWLTELQATAFAEQLAPNRVLPVHDGYVKDFFRSRRYHTYRRELEKRSVQFEGDVGPETAVDV
jgi:hypothetical protein